MQFIHYKTVVGIIALLLLTMFNLSFQNTGEEKKAVVTKEMLIQERLQKRIFEYEKSVKQNCDNLVMERATEVVDSILIARAKASRDTIAKPPRPNRPNRPELLPPTDSTPIAPLLQNDSLQ